MKHVQPVHRDGPRPQVHGSSRNRGPLGRLRNHRVHRWPARVHHGRQFTVMTNDPTVSISSSRNLARFDFTDATRDTPLPGNVNPLDRFVRSAFFLKKLPEPKSEREAIAGILAIARNASVPFGAPNICPGYGLQHRIPHRHRLDQPTLFLRADDRAQRDLDESRPIQPGPRRSGDGPRPGQHKSLRGRYVKVPQGDEGAVLNHGFVCLW